MDIISASFISFQFILHESGLLFTESWSFYKLKRGDIISGENQFCRNSEVLRPPYCVSISKFVWTQIHPHALDFNAFLMIQEYFFKSFEISKSWRGRPNFWGESIFKKVWIIWIPFCNLISKALWVQIHAPSLYFNWFCMIQEYFLQSLEISWN